MKGRQIGFSALVLAIASVSGCDGPTDPDDSPQLTTITVTSEDARTSIMLGETLQLSAGGKDQKGAELQATFTWSSSNATVATVNTSGLVTPVGSGTATIIAESAGKQGTFALTVAGSLHSLDITTDQTWRAADNPHLVTLNIDVDGSAAPVLTIEAGVQIRFRSGAGLTIADFDAGSIRANGTAAAPITMGADATNPSKGFWIGIAIGRRAGPSELHFVTMSHCGDTRAGTSGCIDVDGNAPSLVPQVLVDNVTIQNSSTHGFVSSSLVGFAVGSTRLTVTGAELEPIRLHANVAGSIPTGGTFTGNTKNLVALHGNNVTVSQTWPNLAIPYVPDAFISVSGTMSPTLTLLPGTEIRMQATRDFSVGDCTNSSSGNLVAEGTAAAPIKFTANTTTPTAGFWGQLGFEDCASSVSRLTHAIVEYAGASQESIGEPTLTRGIVVVENDVGAFMTNTTIRFSPDCGVIRRDDEFPWATDFTDPSLNNTFTDNPRAQCGP